jgi:hypothetical protein
VFPGVVGGIEGGGGGAIPIVVGGGAVPGVEVMVSIVGDESSRNKIHTNCQKVSVVGDKARTKKGSQSSNGHLNVWKSQ